jgi:hypothetical protein
MNKHILLLTLFVVSTYFSFGQGTVRGKIADENGETLIGVTIVLKSNKSIGTVTDFDGNYSLKLPDNTPQTLIVSYVSYLPIEENVVVKNNEVLIKNFTMRTSAVEVKEIKITATAIKAKDYFMENIKKKSATTIDYISAETMKKTGDANVVNAVARVSGVSTNGGFITVRGIGDRYIKTTINGSMIPTLDPFTNNIKLDLFPSSLIDNIIITKTASPDLPGDWAGAYLSVETKDYPEKLAVNVETSFGYNSNATFKDVVSSERSSTDWLGYDNDLRDRSHNDFIQVNSFISQYEQMVALGLGSYFNSLGVNASWNEGSTEGINYFKLGLVQLGLLEPALFNDQDAYTNAVTAYNSGSYQSQAYQTINQAAVISAKQFPNNWDLRTLQAPLNFSQSFSIGNQTTLFGKPLGIIAGFRYSNSIQYDPESYWGRVSPDITGALGAPRIATQQISRENNGWSALVNVAYKFTPNHSLALLFMPNFNGQNNVRSLRENVLGTELFDSLLTKAQFYEQRKQLVYQLKSEHYFPKSKIKLEFNASYTDGESITPDFKNLDINIDNDGQYFAGVPDIGFATNRFYRYLDENIFDSRISLELPLSDKPGLTRKIKFGGAYQRNDRNFSQFNYNVFKANPSGVNYQTSGYIIPNNDIDAFFDLNNFEITQNTVNGFPKSAVNLLYFESGNPANRTIGNSDIMAGYFLTDYAINNKWRFEGGVRIEQANIFTDIFKYDSLGLGKNDPRRLFEGDLVIFNAGTLNELSILPSANIIYNLRDNDEAPANIRFNFSQSVARPSIRELSETIVPDFELRADVFGNSDLKMVSITNYDLRFEYYFKNNDHISVSGFYKEFKNHIELVSNALSWTWQNADRSYVVGFEIEGAKKITKNLEFRANVTLVDSRTELIQYSIQYNGGIKTLVPTDTVSRAMFGQAPYVLNGILNYNLDSLGLGLTLSYNVQGPRLVLASVDKAPSIFEMPRHLVDFKVSKKLGKYFGVSLTVRDILNSPVKRSYYIDKDNEVIFDWESLTNGTNYVLGISYKL